MKKPKRENSKVEFRGYGERAETWSTGEMASGAATSFLLNYSGEPVKNVGTKRGKKSRYKKPQRSSIQPYPSISQKNVSKMPTKDTKGVGLMPSKRPTKSTTLIKEPEDPKYALIVEKAPTWSGKELAGGAATSNLLKYSGQSVGQQARRKQPQNKPIVKTYKVQAPKQIQALQQVRALPKQVKSLPKLRALPKQVQKQHIYKVPKNTTFKSFKNNQITTIKSAKNINRNATKIFSTGTKTSKKPFKLRGFK